MTITYEDWIQAIFNHPLADEHWFWKDSGLYGEIENSLSDIEKVTYLTRLFENAEADISKFNDAQINDGLKYLVDNSFSNYMFAWRNKEITSSGRKKFIESIYSIFANLMSVRCNNELGHLNENNMCPVNYICYMWWDVIPIHPVHSFSVETDKMFLDVMKRILAIESTACQESALHGLGHWYGSYPAIVEEIINGYMARFQHLYIKEKDGLTLKNSNHGLPEIFTYALAARKGMVQ